MDDFAGAGTDVLEGVESSPETQTPETQATPQGNSSTEESFFDAKKVAALDPRLVPSFREMQGAWTKQRQALKEQEKTYAGYKDFDSAHPGRLDQARQMLDLLYDPSGQGAVELFAVLGEQFGLTRQQLAGLFGNQQAAVASPQGQPAQQANPNDPNRPFTVGDFQQYMIQQQQAQVAAREDQQVESLLGTYKQYDLSAPANGQQNPARDFVLMMAERQPAQLGYAERIRRGVEAYQHHLDTYAQSVASRQQQAQQGSPGSLGGSMPGAGGPESPRDWGTAHQRALARLNNTDGGFFS